VAALAALAAAVAETAGIVFHHSLCNSQAQLSCLVWHRVQSMTPWIVHMDPTELGPDMKNTMTGSTHPALLAADKQNTDPRVVYVVLRKQVLPHTLSAKIHKELMQ
jgi:hypothetical protein